jgi:hypothetical protein
MKLCDVKSKMVIRYDIDGEVLDLFICGIDKKDGHIEGTVLGKPGRFGEYHSFWVRQDEELAIYSYSGGAAGVLLTPGMTQAEIEARQVAKAAEEVGLEVEVTIDATHRGALYACVIVKGQSMYDDIFSGQWRTRTDGRRTTAFIGGFTIKAFQRRGKSTKSLNKGEFFQKFRWACEDAYRAQQRHQQEAS